MSLFAMPCLSRHLAEVAQASFAVIISGNFETILAYFLSFDCSFGSDR